MRIVLLWLSAVVMTVFSSILASSTSVSAAPAEGTWDTSGQDISINYDGKTYVGPKTVTALSPQGIPGSATYYIASNGNNAVDSVIYFTSTVDTTKDTPGQYVTYDSAGKPAPPVAVTIKPNPQSQQNQSTTSCAVEGIGWIICPVTKFLAWGMDKIFEMLKGFLVVRPVLWDDGAGNETSLYRAWSMMRSFANIAFIIAFLIIIYSQLTSVGLNNYSIKKLLPRIIIAALLVNVSYYICATAVDLSNILGMSLQDLFIDMRGNVVGPGGNSWDLLNASSLSSFILAGGVGGTAAFFGLAGAGVLGSLWLLLPMLGVALISILAALAVLAGRQAIITVLIVISPLAFVAFLLPNTEKWFGKWRELFMKLLLVFPIFSVVFGGSQLAAAIIIQNANSINVVILAMFVQVAPLIVTPLLIRLSGGILAKVGGFVNDRTKGPVDRLRGLAKDQMEKREGQRKTMRLGADGKPILAPRRQAMKRYIQKRAINDLKRKAIIETGEESVKSAFERLSNTEYKLQNVRLKLRNTKLELEDAVAEGNIQFENIKAGDHRDVIRNNLGAKALAQQNELLHNIQHNSQAELINAQRLSAAKNIQTGNFAHAMEASPAMQAAAGGIDPDGPQRALAHALADIEKIRDESVKTAGSIITSRNLTSAQISDVAKGVDWHGVPQTLEMQEAAAKIVISGKNQEAIMDLWKNLDLRSVADPDYSRMRASLVKALKESPSRPAIFGFGTMEQWQQGTANNTNLSGADAIHAAVKSAVDGAKLSATKLASQDKEVIEEITASIRTQGQAAFDQKQLARIKNEIMRIRKTKTLNAQVSESSDALEALSNLIAADPTTLLQADEYVDPNSDPT